MATLLERFEAKVTPEPMSGCWLWIGSRTPEGYGKMWDGERLELAHRLSFRLFKATDPAGYEACHKCDNPGCVNPDHLFLGSGKDNAQDSMRKGRHFTPREENSKLTLQQVEEIRSLPKKLPKGLVADLAAHYGLSSGGFYKVRSGLRWRHV